MTFSPIVPLAGIGGWEFLGRTRPSQQAALERTPVVRRNTEVFAERIPSITSVDALVADRQVLAVALGAFGLADDIDNTFLIRKILSSDTSDPASLASRYADKRYLSLARAFGFGDPSGPRTTEPGFAQRITDLYHDRQFEVAIGDADPDMRLALGFGRDLAAIAGRTSLSQDGKWFTVLATPPLRAVFEGALGLPDSFGILDLDRQVRDLRTRSLRAFGAESIEDLASPDLREKLIRRFLALSQVDASPARQTAASTALRLLQGAVAG